MKEEFTVYKLVHARSKTRTELASSGHVIDSKNVLLCLKEVHKNGL